MPSSKFSVDSLPRLSGKVYVVTGGNAGIGYSTVAGLAAKGAKVYMGARTESKANEAIQEIKAKTPSADIHFLQMDLSRFDSVITAAKKLRAQETAIHGLVNNAGIMGVPFSITDDGPQTNYLSHWLLAHHLLPLLQAAHTGRLIDVSSDGHDLLAPKEGIVFYDTSLESQGAMTRYGQSKLANVLHAKEMHRRYGPGSSQSESICTAAVHPGHINTNLNKQATGMAPGIILRIATPIMRCAGVLDDQDKGALSSLFAVASDSFKAADSGSYVIPYAVIGTPSAHAQDAALAEKLWNWTEAQLESKGLLTL